MLGVNTNVYSLNAQRNLSNTQGTLQTSLQRLSSGLRINSAKDDATGLATATRLTTQILELNVQIRQAGDGISTAQVAEGALDEVTNIAQRMNELAGNGTGSAEAVALAATANSILDNTKFGEVDAFSAAGVATARDAITIEGTSTASALKTAISAINDIRTTLGANQNAMESSIKNLSNVVENVSAARSRTLDADFAVETSNLTKAQILQQAGVAMLSQANQIPQAALSLLQ